MKASVERRRRSTGVSRNPPEGLRAVNETEEYRRQGYVALPALFPVEVLHAFYQQLQSDLQHGGRSMKSFVARGPLLRRDAIEIYARQYPPMLTFLWGLTPRMAQVVGCELLPTYSYLRLYQRGDICRVHSDRYACEHSLSLTVAYGEDKPWPLCVESARSEPKSAVADQFASTDFGSVAMHAGDGVAYQGVHHRHGRVEPNPNSWSAHLFLHWVDRNGPYKAEAFDRPAMGRAGVADGGTPA